MNRKTDNLADALPHTPKGDYTSLPCRKCGGLTPHATLAAHGGQCYPCFAHWCRHGDPEPAYGQDTNTVRAMKDRAK